jgi:hypothetical protein
VIPGRAFQLRGEWLVAVIVLNLWGCGADRRASPAILPSWHPKERPLMDYLPPTGAKSLLRMSVRRAWEAAPVRTLLERFMPEQRRRALQRSHGVKVEALDEILRAEYSGGAAAWLFSYAGAEAVEPTLLERMWEKQARRTRAPSLRTWEGSQNSRSISLTTQVGHYVAWIEGDRQLASLIQARAEDRLEKIPPLSETGWLKELAAPRNAPLASFWSFEPATQPELAPISSDAQNPWSTALAVRFDGYDVSGSAVLHVEVLGIWGKQPESVELWTSWSRAVSQSDIGQILGLRSSEQPFSCESEPSWMRCRGTFTADWQRLEDGLYQLVAAPLSEL